MNKGRIVTRFPLAETVGARGARGCGGGHAKGAQGRPRFLCSVRVSAPVARWKYYVQPEVRRYLAQFGASIRRSGRLIARWHFVKGTRNTSVCVRGSEARPPRLASGGTILAHTLIGHVYSVVVAVDTGSRDFGVARRRRRL